MRSDRIKLVVNLRRIRVRVIDERAVFVRQESGRRRTVESEIGRQLIELGLSENGQSKHQFGRMTAQFIGASIITVTVR